MYYCGLGVEQDVNLAEEWYEKAYDFNYEFLQSDECDEWVADVYRERAVQSANRVAEMYEKGLGVAQDADKAAEWYTKAEEASDSSSDTE